MSTIHHKVAALCATAIAMGLMGCQFVAGIANEKDGAGGAGTTTSTSNTAIATSGSTGTGMACRQLECSPYCKPRCDNLVAPAQCPIYPNLPSCCAVCAGLPSAEFDCRVGEMCPNKNPFAASVPCRAGLTNFKDVLKAVCSQMGPTDTGPHEDWLLHAAECPEKANCYCQKIAGTPIDCESINCPPICPL